MLVLAYVYVSANKGIKTRLSVHICLCRTAVDIYLPVIGYSSNTGYGSRRGANATCSCDDWSKFLGHRPLGATTALTNVSLMGTVWLQPAHGDCYYELVIVKSRCSCPVCRLIRTFSRSENETDILRGFGRCIEISDICTGDWRRAVWTILYAEKPSTAWDTSCHHRDDRC